MGLQNVGGPNLATVGFDGRVPGCRDAKPTPSLDCSGDPSVRGGGTNSATSVVGLFRRWITRQK